VDRYCERAGDIQRGRNQAVNGVYFYRLTTEKFSQTRKLIILP
jgi:hypothetical protein